jgi:hypothetical protein
MNPAVAMDRNTDRLEPINDFFWSRQRPSSTTFIALPAYRSEMRQPTARRFGRREFVRIDNSPYAGRARGAAVFRASPGDEFS